MNTQHIVNAIAGSVLVLITSGAFAGHVSHYRYDESTDTIEFSYHGGADSSHIQVASAGPVSFEADHSAPSQDDYDWFLDQ